MLIIDSPEVDLVPLALFSLRLRQGWLMVPGYPLDPGDYAVVMSCPSSDKHTANTSRAAVWRNKLGAKKRAAIAEAIA